MPRVPSSAGYFFDFRGVGDPVGFVVHTSAFTAHRSAIPGKLWFLGNLTRTLGTITCAGRGWGNLQACHRRARTFGSQPPSRSYSRRRHSQTTGTAMLGKLWFPRNRGTNMTENAHFRIEKACRGYPLRLGTFSTFGSWRPSGFCSPYKCLHGP